MNCRVPLLGSLHEDEIPGYSYNATEEKPMVWDWESWFFPQTFANLRILNEQSNSKVNFTGLFQERRCLETATDSWVLAFWPLQDCHFWASYAARDRHVEGSSILDFMRLAAYRCHSCKLWAFPHVQFIFFDNRLIQKICMVQIWRRAKQPQGLKSHVSWTFSHNPMRFFQSGADPLKAGFGAVTKIHGTAPPQRVLPRSYSSNDSTFSQYIGAWQSTFQMVQCSIAQPPALGMRPLNRPCGRMAQRCTLGPTALEKMVWSFTVVLLCRCTSLRDLVKSSSKFTTFQMINLLTSCR